MGQQEVTAALIGLGNEGDAGVLAASPLIPTVNLEDRILLSTNVPRPKFFEIYTNLANLWDGRGDYKLALYHLVKKANNKSYPIPEKFSLLLAKRKLLDGKGKFLPYVQAMVQKFFEATGVFSTLEWKDDINNLERGSARGIFSEETANRLTREGVYSLWQYYHHVMRRMEVFLGEVFREAAEKRQKSIYYHDEYLPSGNATKNALNELSFEGKKALIDYLLIGNQKKLAEFAQAQKIDDYIAKKLLVLVRLGYYLHIRFKTYPSEDDMNKDGRGLWYVLNNLVRYVSEEKLEYLKGQLKTGLQKFLAGSDENIEDAVQEFITVANNYWTETSSPLKQEGEGARSDSPLADGDAGVPSEEEVDEIIESIFSKHKFSHFSDLTEPLKSFYDYLKMNYLEKLPWMSNKNWRKTYQKRNVWEDQEIKRAYDKAIEGLGEILDKNKDDKKSAQELAQKIVNEFITEIIKLNIAAELAFNYDLKPDSKKEIEFYLSSILEKKTDSMRIDATAYSIASTQRIFLDKAIKRAEEIFAKAKEWLESALGLNASSSLAQGEDSKVPVFKGGIDLHQDLLDLKTQGASSSIRYNFDPAKLKAISANLAGFEPKIISIKRNGK